MALKWPSETVLAEDKIEQWHQPGSNRVLDFHSDPMKADLVVFSDGNHHMALLQCLKAFHQGKRSINPARQSETRGETVARIYARHGFQHWRDIHLADREDFRIPNSEFDSC